MKKNQKGLSALQLTMMALGTVIGGSFFLGSSIAIHAAGPGVLISYCLGGILVYFILYALSEMTAADPAAGSFRNFAAAAFGPGTGFVVGWVYWTGMVLAMSSEAAAISILIRSWFPSLSITILGSIIIIGVTMINLIGAEKLSTLESSLAAVKVFAIAAFIIIGLLLITGLIPGSQRIGIGELAREPLLPGGIKSIAGSMLIVMFSYAGFEIISLAASETDDPRKTIPKAINYTVVSILGLYILSSVVLMPLIPTSILNEEISPMVAALDRWGINWAGNLINFVLVTAVLSTMLATMFGLGRMVRSLALEGHAPKLLKDGEGVPMRGILFSGFGMLFALALGHLFPSVYLFLISSGGFAALFTYAVILASHIRLRKKYGSSKEGKSKMAVSPYLSWIALISMIVIILSMPLISGQSAGLIAGLIMLIVYSFAYFAMKYSRSFTKPDTVNIYLKTKIKRVRMSMEFSEELTQGDKDLKKDKDDK